MTREELVDLCYDDLPFFAATCLKVKDKAGNLVPLVFNESQLQLHAAVEKQKRETGLVRMLVLKGRRQGISTYVAARYYHATAMKHGTNSYILTHEQPATNALFDIVDRFHRHNPLAPHVGASNEKELLFDRLDSGYVVATAGQKAGGRGQSLKMFHGSEVAFWPNAATHFAASVQAVPLLAGTEVILESTANGPGGEFYERWQDGTRELGDYRCTFLPWTIDADNARAVSEDFELRDDPVDGDMSEQEYAASFGLSNEQMAWRRNKIIELRDPDLFKQEFPINASEAFVTAGHESFIKPLAVLRARKRQVAEGGPLILGVDPAGGGGDRFAVAARRGNRVLWVIHRNKIDQTEAEAWLKDLITKHKPARVNIDSGNIGAPLITRLKMSSPEMALLVRAVNFGARSQFKYATPQLAGPKNRRAEMWQRSNDWLNSEEGVQIPDDDTLQADATGPRKKPTLDNDLLLESKEEMKTRGVRSSDLWDAVALTFASLEYFRDYVDKVPTPRAGEPDAERARLRDRAGPTVYDSPAPISSTGWMS